MELKGRRSLTEPEGRNDEAKPEEWSPEAADGRRLTKAEPEGRGSPVELAEGRPTVEMREPGAKVQPIVRRTEMESRAWRWRRGILTPGWSWRLKVPRRRIRAPS